MPDFAAARRTMVDCQVRPADVTDLSLLAALGEVSRERFVPPASAPFAYLDQDLAVGHEGGAARSMLKPMVLAKLMQVAEIAPTDRVLDVGCLTGYSSAVLGRVAGSVVALEEDRALAQVAERELAGLSNVKVVSGPLVLGWPLDEPYDVIVMEGATEVIPEALFSQLKDGGRLVCVYGQGPLRRAMLYTRAEGETSGRPVFDAAAPVLPGFARKRGFVF
jgi:protein-L-isoaspartate(D-aspartate) O-methyltransferase